MSIEHRYTDLTPMRTVRGYTTCLRWSSSVYGGGAKLSRCPLRNDRLTETNTRTRQLAKGEQSPRSSVPRPSPNDKDLEELSVTQTGIETGIGVENSEKASAFNG